MLAVLQADPCRPAPLAGKFDKGPDGHVKAMQQDGAAHIRALEQGGDVIGDLTGDSKILLADFDQDPEGAGVIGEGDKALRVGDGCEPGLDADAAVDAAAR